MINRYDPDVLEEINANADLLSYIQQNSEVEQRGGDYYMHCDKHVDNTASLCISPGKNAFYCFSCKRRGYMINYLMEYEGMRFDDAVQKAAQLANVNTDTMCKSSTIMFLKRIRAMHKKDKEKYVHKILENSELQKYSKEEAQEWLDEGIHQDIMDWFGIRLDAKHNRIVYPVYDFDGNLINIKGRTRYKNFKELKIPKYINYFEVGCLDYLQSLNFTIDDVRAAGELIIFESIKSTMLACGWGYMNCASAESHTLSDEQIALIARLHVDVILAYDSDVDYWSGDVRKNIDKLRKITNVYIVEDREGLLGGKEAKNAPVDCGEEIWEELYENKRKVV